MQIFKAKFHQNNYAFFDERTIYANYFNDVKKIKLQ